MFRNTMVFWQLLLLWLATASAQDDAPVISITGLGDVKGTTSTSYQTGKTIYSFMSIPYAKAPTGDLRFRAPVPASAWEGVLDGSKNGPICPQPKTFKSPFTPNGEGDASPSSEDCLRLDVHTRQIEPGKKLPVLVFLHGGAFAIGGSHSIRPNILLDNEIVLVAPQFRLGPLGLLNFNEDNILGNAALYDQNLALRWVKEHIEAFGGDPSQVTLGGQGTGAAMASHHMLSSLSADLFRSIITHGGAATAHWAIETKPLSSSLRFAKAVGCNINESTENVVACIKSKSTEDLVNAYSGEDGFLLSPSVQTTNQNETMAFINEYTFDILKSYKYKSVPLLAGSNKHEGLLYLEYVYNNWLVPNNYTNDYEYLRHKLVTHITDTYDVPDTSGVLADALTKLFLDQASLGNFADMFDGLVDICGSAFVKGNVYRLVQFNSANSSSYLYTFNYYGKDHLLHHAPITPSKNGVLHGDELLYLFPQNDVVFDGEQEVVSTILSDLWANFIISGNPTPEGSRNTVTLPQWLPFDKEKDNFLIIEQNATALIAHNYRPQYNIAKNQGLEAMAT